VSYLSEVLADGPALYWRAEEASGSTAADSSGNGRSGEFRNAPTLGVTGALAGTSSKAVELNGSNQSVRSATYIPFVAGSARTFEGWAWRDVSTAEHTLVGATDGGSSPCLKLGANNQDVIWSADSSVAVITWTAAWPGNAQWVHWVLVFNEATNQATLYINGTLVSTKEHTVNYNTPGSVDLGARNNGFACWDGKLDEFAIYEKELSAARIKVHWEVGKNGSAPIELKASIASTSAVGVKLLRTRLLKGAVSSASALSGGLLLGRVISVAIESASSIAAKLTSAPKAPPPRVAVRQEYPPSKLAVRIESPGGAPSRWAADECLTENVISDLRLVSEMPGGEKEMTGVLARDPRTSWPDLAPYSKITVYGSGGEVVWQGRLDKALESDIDHRAISPAAVGGQAALDDDKALIGPGFIAGAFDLWGDGSLQRRTNNAAANVVEDGAKGSGWQAGEGQVPSLTVDFRGVTTQSGKSNRGEFYFDGGGVDLGALLYHFRLLAGAGAANYLTQGALLRFDADDTGAMSGTDHDAITNLETYERIDATEPGYRYARITSDRQESGAGGVRPTNFHAWEYPKVLGLHGLTLQGEWPEVGFTVSQMLGYAIPLHTDLTAAPEDLEDSGYIVQHAWFADPGPISQVVAELTKYELLDWFVHGKRFQLRFPGAYGRNWQAYAGPSGLQEQGLDGSRLWREILVSYRDFDGTTRTVGPPGSRATVEDPALEITDPDHPAVRAAITRRDRLDLRGISTPARAIEAGEIWLREANQLSRSGSATLSDYVLDDCGVFHPACLLDAGDRVRFPDAADTSYRKVVRRAYEDSTKTVAVDLDAPPEGLQALLERMQADIQSLALA
jgi:hypothetical protein